MATQYAGVNLGDAEESVTFGTSTTSKNVEITYNDAVILKDSDLEVAVEKIKSAINKRTFPAS